MMRRNVYHPAFGGSFSLKKVAAAIVPNLSYKGLGVAEGIQAGIVWGRLVDSATCADEKAQLKRALTCALTPMCTIYAAKNSQPRRLTTKSVKPLGHR